MNIYPDFSEHNYQILSELGRNREGGRISYLAECLNTGQRVVVKRCSAVLKVSFLERLHQEAVSFRSRSQLAGF